MILKSIRAGLLFITMAALVLSPTLPANAVSNTTESQLSAEVKAEIRDFWETYSVSPEVQDRLLQKIAEGEQTQATLGHVEPVSVREVKTKSSTETISTYPDGSISVSTVETGPQKAKKLERGTITPMDSIDGCTARSGSGYAQYSNCLVRTQSDYITITFRANYERYQGGGSQITYHGSPNVETRGGGASFPTNTRWVRSSNSAGVEAVVTYQSYYTTSRFSETVQISLRVNFKGVASVTRF